MNFSEETRYKLLNLFSPGDGGKPPPHLAGRNRERQFLQSAVYTLMKEHLGNQNMIIYGPRGNGKTALLEELESKTREDYGDKIDVLSITPSIIMTPGGLDNFLAIKNRNQEKKGVKKLDFGASAYGLGANVGVELSAPEKAAMVTETLILQVTKKTPLILIIDEAHNLPPELAGRLLNASQIVRKEKNPFFLVLAGTPGLMRTLGQAEASFWERGEEFPMGRLSVEESVEALVKPLEPFGFPFAKGVAENVATQANCYPFFLQVWGKCLVEELVDSGQSRIDQYMVADAEPKVTERRDRMYVKRFTELKDRELLPLAGEVAKAFIANDNKPISVLDIDALVGDLEKVKALERLGYIWQVEDPVTLTSYEPGIPSMMNFVKRRTVGMVPPEKTKEAETEQDTGMDY